MKRNLKRIGGWISLLFGVCMMVSCDGGSDGPSGNSTVTGNVVSSDMAALNLSSVPAQRESKWAQFSGALSDLLIPSATAATTNQATGGPGGILVALAGPTDRDTVTADDGTFTISDLPAGAYQLTFSLNGQEVTYRGNSGQIATISVGTNETAQLINIRINGGHINIGNVRIIQN